MHQTVHQVMDEVKQRQAGVGAGHGLDHVMRVLAIARRIQADVGGDLFVVELAALLHDVGDAKFHGGVERSGEISREILSRLHVDSKTIDHVVQIVDNLSFRKQEVAEELTLEGKIVQDADRLDAMGAIGIVRTIEYGASINRPFFMANDPDAESGLNHFHQKLFRLRELMNTDTGRALAADREQFMRSFLEQYYSETDAQPPEGRS